MTLEVPQHIRQRLPAVIDDLKNAVGQEAAKAYLTRITTVESLELEPGAKLCDNSWMEYIDEDCMTDTSDHSYSTPFSPSRKIEEPILNVTNFQTEAEPCCPARRLKSPTCIFVEMYNTLEPKKNHKGDSWRTLGAFYITDNLFRLQ